MSCDIVYYKNFSPAEDFGGHADDADASQNALGEIAPEDMQKLDALLQKIEYVVTVTALADRQNTSQLFIALAIQIAEAYRLDTMILRDRSCISVDFSFNGSPCMHLLKPLFLLADDFSILSHVRDDRDITLFLEYRTHISEDSLDFHEP